MPPFPEFLAASDVRSRHTIEVDGDAAAAFAAIKQVDLGRSRLIRILFRLRGLSRRTETLAGLEQIGFTPLLDEPDRALVLGIVGRFWSPRGQLQRLSIEEFRHFEQPGWAKAVWSFVIEPTGTNRVRLVTETHIRCFGDGARRRFRLYWTVVGPFSGLIRRDMLRLVRQAVEAR